MPDKNVETEKKDWEDMEADRKVQKRQTPQILHKLSIHFFLNVLFFLVKKQTVLRLEREQTIVQRAE